MLRGGNNLVILVGQLRTALRDVKMSRCCGMGGVIVIINKSNIGNICHPQMKKRDMLNFVPVIISLGETSRLCIID